MLPQALTWFFVTFSKEFRQGQRMAFEVVRFISLKIKDMRLQGDGLYAGDWPSRSWPICWPFA